MRKYFPIYEEAVSHLWLWNCSILKLLIYEENFILVFLSVGNTVSIFFVRIRAESEERWTAEAWGAGALQPGAGAGEAVPLRLRRTAHDRGGQEEGHARLQRIHQGRAGEGRLTLPP